MKAKIIFLILVFLLALGYEVKAQYEFFQEKTNFVFFSGLVKHQQSDQLGAYYGLYADYLAYKSSDHRLSFGPYGVISRSDSRYQARNGFNRNLEYGGGVSLGYYEPSFSFRYQSFIGASFGIIQGKEKQEFKKKDGFFEAWQKDLYLSGSLNFNLLKTFGLRPDLFPRSQIQIRYKKPIKSEKVAYWNSGPVETYVWDKTYLEVLAKQNLYKDLLSWRSNIYYSPKIVAFYSHSKGASQNFYGLGAEVSLFREYRDDFLSVGALYKVSRRFYDNYFVISLNLNLSSLISE